LEALEILKIPWYEECGGKVILDNRGCAKIDTLKIEIKCITFRSKF